MTELERVLNRLERVTAVAFGSTWFAVCPMEHPDPSTLTVRRQRGELTFRCQHGCSKPAILNALGLRHS